MQVNLEKQFPVEASGADSWRVLSNINTVASCMPGAEITEQLDDSHYKGKVKAKVGPATMAFDGTIEILGLDPEKRELRMTSKGQDSKGTSSVQMDLTAWVLDRDDGGSKLKGEALVNANGKIASLGGRLMTQVADQVLNQFGKNFSSKVVALAAANASSDAEAAEPAAEEEEPQAINGLAFAWSVIVAFFKSLFGKKPANVS